MSAQVRARQLFRYRSLHIDKRKPLGRGAYGAVYKAKCDQLPCAAKVLHPTILDPLDPGADKIMERFEQECAFLESIRHPNIVQYLGMSRDAESRLPVLLMELLDESLTKMLENSPKALPYFVEVDICHDIALAVAYLHSNDIIHRDLSSNNVLMVAKRRAKVTDFGMSRISGAAPSMTPLTLCPGTLAYMSPEALKDPPTYTKKLDCFSEGVMMIQVCTRLWPEPGPGTKTVQDARSPTGRMQMPVLERERRRKHIDKITGSHGLLPIAMDCLHYQENERPSSEELCERLAGLKETREYRESKERVEREQNHIAELERSIGEERATVQQLRGEIQLLSSQVEEQGRLQSRNEQLNRQLEEQEQVTAALERQVEQLQQQLSQQNQKPSQPPSAVAVETLASRRQLQQHHPMEAKPPPPPVAPRPRSLSTSAAPLETQLSGRQLQQRRSMKVKPPPPPVAPRPRLGSLKKKMMLGQWRDGEKAPIKMSRGAAVVDGNVAYFMHWNGRIYSYNKRWSELPKCPCEYSSLAVIKGRLTAIGGRRGGLLVRVLSGGSQNTLLSIVDNKWVEHFPPMPTQRYNTASVTTQHHLIVAGGDDGSTLLNTVEAMDIETLVWSTAASLPCSYSGASAAICGGHLYMLGGYDYLQDNHTKLVLTCSLTNLLQSSSQTSSHSVWNSISATPVYLSTCVAVDGELLAVGGMDERGMTTSAVYKYNPTTDSWDLISDMPTARRTCLIAVLPTNEMMVVGGEVPSMLFGTVASDKVEIANTV